MEEEERDTRALLLMSGKVQFMTLQLGTRATDPFGKEGTDDTVDLDPRSLEELAGVC